MRRYPLFSRHHPGARCSITAALQTAAVARREMSVAKCMMVCGQSD